MEATKELRTTAQWWADVSQDDTKMIEWLKAQYHGEVTASTRIAEMITQYNVTGKNKETLERIVEDEKIHAEWVRCLLASRGIPAEVLEKEERYWNATLPKAVEVNTFEYMCAVAHLAETMRLDRITLLSSDARFADIADIFSRILPDEEFHAKAFGEMSTPEAINQAREYHNIGMNALGLVA